MAIVIVTVVGLFVFVVVAALAAFYLFSLYNQLVRLSRNVDQTDQNIDVLLKQRQDELSKLIDAAQEMMRYEEDLLTEITEAREKAERADTPTEQANADQEIRNVMASFRARAEEYPELKAQQNLQQFQERISDLESQISDRREVYNEAVTRYNTRIEQFPYVIFARQFGFDERELFTATEEELEDVDVGEAFSS